jgi:hypothetical protein
MKMVFNRLTVERGQRIAIKEKEESTNIVFGSIDTQMANLPVSGWRLCRDDSGVLNIAEGPGPCKKAQDPRRRWSRNLPDNTCGFLFSR